MSLRFDSRLLEPPVVVVQAPPLSRRSVTSSEMSSLGDLHDDSTSVTSDAAPSEQYKHSEHSHYQQQQQYDPTQRCSTRDSLRLDSIPMDDDYNYEHYDGYDNDEHVIVRGYVPISDLRNVSALHAGIGAALGVALALALGQINGARDATLTQWLVVSGTLYTRALLCAVVPTVFVHAVLAHFHFSTLNKAKALTTKMLVYFAVSTLVASAIGALVVLCFVSTMAAENNVLRLASVGTNSSNSINDHFTTAPFTLQCPATDNSSSHNTTLVLDRDGALRCTTASNATRFRAEDLAHVFRIPSIKSINSTSIKAIPSLGELVRQLLASVCPLSVADAIAHSNVLSVVVAGAALGSALLPFVKHSSVAGTRDSSLLLLLLTQFDVVLSRILRGLLQILPFALVPLACDVILQSTTSRTDSLIPSTLDAASFVGVLILALILDVATVVVLARVATKSNPLPFVSQLLPAQLAALGTSSSLLSLPATVRSIATTQQVSMPLAHSVCAAGAALNKNGSALYLSAVSVYVVHAAGLGDTALTAPHVALLVLASALGACVLLPLPRSSALVVGAMLVGALDVSSSRVSALLAFVATIDWVCDPVVTMVNVTNSAVVAFVLAHEMDERYRAPSLVSTQPTDETESARMQQRQ